MPRFAQSIGAVCSLLFQGILLILACWLAGYWASKLSPRLAEPNRIGLGLGPNPIEQSLSLTSDCTKEFEPRNALSGAHVVTSSFTL